ncbi:M20 family metallopeptidase [Microbacterium azadirachtae]|uniref:Probable succinyl-diaminopimelate desuccinylase n=1 Tax=Microbacterium azadirachtae TaxID=582680 RepID=A0A0F0LIP9_9MICO|nr:ArgE/DapE family deacylase [Microbacterium azadirachtae]KJL31406.1 Succinyl-diaminopimelate desuccinylase [Microbacterium azadirachtae]
MSTIAEWEQRLLAAVDESQEELLALAGLLIRTPSENPPGDCTEIAEVIAGRLRDEGMDLELFDAGEGRVSVVAHRGEKGEDRHLVFAGHSDVVPIGDVSRWTFPPLAGDVVDGWLRGRGASDMKAGLAGLLHVYTLLHRLDVPLRGRISLAAVPDEETGGRLGADWLLGQGVLDGATGGVIAEPAERDHPTIGQKGSNWFRLTVRGIPGHGSLQPVHGVSANLLGARAILALQRLWDMVPEAPEELRQLIADSQHFAVQREGYEPEVAQVFERVTINVGTIRGGTSTNVVADTCVIEFDTRVPIGLSRVQVLDRAREILAEEGIDAEIDPIGFMSEPNWTAPTDPIVETLVGALRELSDPEAQGVLQWASSDARTFRSHGIPVLQYGPADLKTIHSFDERARAGDVVLAAKVYALTALRYLGVRDADDLPAL